MTDAWAVLPVRWQGGRFLDGVDVLCRVGIFVMFAGYIRSYPFTANPTNCSENILYSGRTFTKKLGIVRYSRDIRSTCQLYHGIIVCRRRGSIGRSGGSRWTVFFFCQHLAFVGGRSLLLSRNTLSFSCFTVVICTAVRCRL